MYLGINGIQDNGSAGVGSQRLSTSTLESAIKKNRKVYTRQTHACVGMSGIKYRVMRQRAT